MHTYIHTCIHTHIRTHVYTYMSTCIHILWTTVEKILHAGFGLDCGTICGKIYERQLDSNVYVRCHLNNDI